MFPQAQVHAFELVPDIANRLAARFEHDPRVLVNRCGLDGEAGTVEVHYYPAFSEGSGLNDAHAGFDAEVRTAEVVTGDAYCRERGIDRIELLKIDVEGGEQRVLRGFEAMLARGAVKLIQFEYGLPNVVSRVFLADLYELFQRHGYAVGKVLPNHVDFAPYDRSVHEDFRGPNYVAVVRDRPDLAARLAGSASPPAPA